MRIAYIVSAYKSFDQLVRLVRRIHDSDVSVFIHVDARSGPIDDVVTAVSDLPGVHYLQRHRCAWGGFGHVAATLKGIGAINAARAGHDYAVLLTGQDYPIKANDEIRDVLTAAGGLSYMNYFALPTSEWEGGGLDRIQRWHIEVLNRRFACPPAGWSFPKRRFPSGFRPYGGSSYWCLALDCIKYVHDFVAANPRFVNFFRHVDVPDELFFQTLLLNSPLADRIVNDDLRYIEWRNERSGSPDVLTSVDFPAIHASPKLFARKFDSMTDAKILDRIDEELLGVQPR
jgi:hypothetical protein